VTATGDPEVTGPTRSPSGWTGWLTRALGFGLSLYALYWVLAIVPAQVYRPTFLLIALAIAFLAYPARVASRDRVTAVDWLLIVLSAASLLWPVVQGQAFELRAATPSPIDVALGLVLLLVVLEATRRTTGLMLPVTAALFLVYAWAGPVLDRVGLSLIAHRGYSLERIVGTLYVTLEGVLGVPLDVAATYIVLFTIYGAVVERGGAGRFFLDWAMAATGARGRVNPGRTVTVAGYLLGALSGSGVANTVTLGAVAWPLMRKAGYGAEPGGAVLAAAGIGAILAPPVMGATAFLMAEFLKVAYFDIAMMAIVPAALYYGSLLVVVEADARRAGVEMRAPDGRSLGAVTRSGWQHFVSFVVMVALMVRGVTAFLAVFWATVVACAASFRNRDEALMPRRLAAALTSGGLSVVPIVATTAAAGIIVGVITLTGLGLKAASLIVTLAGASRILTTLYAALAVWALGLAVPVTACYIIAAVMVAPALTQVGISVEAAHMFVFYYAVLSEVSPPTALSPFAAAAITGGNPFRTTMLTWKYATPAFLVPFAFTWTPMGEALLLRGTATEIAVAAAMSALGVAAMAIGAAGYFLRPLSGVERVLAIAGSVMLLSIDRRLGAAGLGLLIVAFTLQFRTSRTVDRRLETGDGEL
jgi:TRAP transporter 4TM/12TM fusion protein